MHLAETCGRSLVFEKDGSLYSCDHFVYPEYKVGNLRDENRRIADAVYRAQQRRFGCNKRESLNNYCKQWPIALLATVVVRRIASSRHRMAKPDSITFVRAQNGS